jgi:hypothetical protein
MRPRAVHDASPLIEAALVRGAGTARQLWTRTPRKGCSGQCPPLYLDDRFGDHP